MTTQGPLVLVAGGGTGGHLYPGLAVAEALQARGVNVAFVGTEFGLESRVVPARGFVLHLVPGAPVRGGGARRLVHGLRAAWRGTRGARALVRGLSPAVVLGVGGYASFAAVVAARLERIPIVLQEQNALPGLANRVLGRLARRVCIGFEAAASFFPADRTLLTGNPIRRSVLEAAAAPRVDGRLGLLVFGGSQGAHRINRAVLDALTGLGERASRLTICHQTGARDLAEVRAGYAQAGLEAQVLAFIDSMGTAYAAADLVVARAGAMSCAELTARGLPAILVPYPHAAGDHQRRNADALVTAGAAELILDHELDGGTLRPVLARLLDDARERRRMAERSRELGRPEAAERVARECLRVAGGQSLEADPALR